MRKHAAAGRERGETTAAQALISFNFCETIALVIQASSYCSLALSYTGFNNFFVLLGTSQQKIPSLCLML